MRSMNLKARIREIYTKRRNRLLLRGKISFLEPDRAEKQGILKTILESINFIGNLNGKLILDLGCGKKPYLQLFKEARCIGLELPKMGFAEVYGTALFLPFKDGVFDLVLCTQVLEHINEPEAALNEIFRVLKTGGYLIMTVPFIWGIHDEPNDYFRFTKYGLKNLLNKAGFEIIFLEDRGNFWDVIVQCISLKFYGYPKSIIADVIKRFVCATIQILFLPLSLIIGNKFKNWCLGYGVLAKKH